jgi:GT2 family glycosyltransferase
VTFLGSVTGSARIASVSERVSAIQVQRELSADEGGVLARHGAPLASVSVVIPAFNAETHIEAAVASALAQTHTPYEVIVVDDGSTDRTADVAGAFGPSVTVVRTGSRGAGGARNAGARAATGEWLAFLDADDTWTREKLEVQARSMADDVAMVYSDRFNVGNVDGLPDISGMHLDMTAGESIVSLMCDNVITTSSVVIRRSVFEELGGFSEDHTVLPAEDWELWLRVVAGYKIRLCPEPLVHYRLHESSMSRRDLRMNRARLTVVTKALSAATPAAITPEDRRRVMRTVWLHNAADAKRAGHTVTAVGCCLRAVSFTPLQWPPWRDLAKAVLGRA